MVLVLTPPVATPCRGADPLDQLWPELDFFVNTGQHSRLFFLTAGTRVRQSGYTDGQLGVHWDRYFGPVFTHRGSDRPDATRSRLLSIRVGYLFGKTPSGSTDPFVEHTPTLDVSPRFYPAKGILVTDRNRYDFRFLNGTYTPRYRNRLKIERTFQAGKRSVTPYAHVEAFYDRRYDSFHRFRYAAGAEFEISRRVVLEGYYLRQQDSRAEPHGLDVAGIAVQIYIH